MRSQKGWIKMPPVKAGCLAALLALMPAVAFAGTGTNGIPSNGLPGNGVPGNGVPGNGVPGNGVPSNGVPGNGAPGNGVPTGCPPGTIDLGGGICIPASGCSLSIEATPASAAPALIALGAIALVVTRRRRRT